MLISIKKRSGYEIVLGPLGHHFVRCEKSGGGYDILLETLDPKGLTSLNHRLRPAAARTCWLTGKALKNDR